MGFVLCPRCELNYMKDTEKYCPICTQEMRGTAPKDEVELCSICNENPVLPGRDVCSVCLRELENSRKSSGSGGVDDGDDGSSPVTDIDSVANMDEIMPIEDRDGFDDDTLSLENVREDEERMEEDEEEDSEN